MREFDFGRSAHYGSEVYQKPVYWTKSAPVKKNNKKRSGRNFAVPYTAAYLIAGMAYRGKIPYNDKIATAPHILPSKARFRVESL